MRLYPGPLLCHLLVKWLAVLLVPLRVSKVWRKRVLREPIGWQSVGWALIVTVSIELRISSSVAMGLTIVLATAVDVAVHAAITVTIVHSIGVSIGVAVMIMVTRGNVMELLTSLGVVVRIRIRLGWGIQRGSEFALALKQGLFSTLEFPLLFRKGFRDLYRPILADGIVWWRWNLRYQRGLLRQCIFFQGGTVHGNISKVRKVGCFHVQKIDSSGI